VQVGQRLPQRGDQRLLRGLQAQRGVFVDAMLQLLRRFERELASDRMGHLTRPGALVFRSARAARI
jgi:hypothetical protein